MQKKIIETPFERLILISNGTQLVKVQFLFDTETEEQFSEIPEKDDDVLLEATRQFVEYFAGERKQFELPLMVEGTAFQKAVWNVLATIPYGKCLTYKEISEQTGSPKAFRAAGGACKANSHVIIIPCHRVLGANGSYTGFAGDKVFMKENLLQHEASVLSK